MTTDDALNETLNDAGENDTETPEKETLGSDLPVETSPAFAITAETDGEVLQVAAPPPPNVGLLGKLREMLFREDARLTELDVAVERFPLDAANYLLRGELLMDRGRRGDEESAAVDFYRAAELAGAQVEAEDWGITAQMVRDRALAGLNELHARGILIENA